MSLVPQIMILAWLLPAQATRMTYNEVPCPLGAGIVRIHQSMSANTHGGYDSDLAEYSSQGQFREYAVASCADNLFSLYAQDISQPIADKLKPRLEQALEEEVARLPDPQNPLVWERYQIAARMYQEMGTAPARLGELYLQASWTARDRAVGYYEGLQGPEQTRKLLDLGRMELTKDLPRAARKTVTYNLARVAHRGGYNNERAQFLAEFDQLRPHDEQEQAALEQFQLIADEVEPHYQDLAIAAFQLSLKQGDLTAESRLRITYLLGDLHRRRDKPEEALRLYQEVLENPKSPIQLQTMARVLSKQLMDRYPELAPQKSRRSSKR